MGEIHGTVNLGFKRPVHEGYMHGGRNEQKKTWLDHSASEKTSPLSNYDALLVWKGKQWGSQSFLFHVLTTHPQKHTLLSGKLLARQFLKASVCAWFASERRISEDLRLGAYWVSPKTRFPYCLGL